MGTDAFIALFSLLHSLRSIYARFVSALTQTKLVPSVILLSSLPPQTRLLGMGIPSITSARRRMHGSQVLL